MSFECLLCYNEFELDNSYLCSKFHIFCENCINKIHNIDSINAKEYKCIYCSKITKLYKILNIDDIIYYKKIEKKQKCKLYIKLKKIWDSIFN